MESLDIFGSPIDEPFDQTLFEKVTADLANGQLKVQEIAFYLQSLLKLRYFDSEYWIYDEKRGVWVVVEAYRINNQIAQLFSDYCPTKVSSAKLRDIRTRLLDLVRENFIMPNETVSTQPVSLNFTNGLYLIRSDGFIKHTRFSYSMYQIPWAFDRKAECPNWIEFLRFVTNDNDDLMRLLRCFFAYVLSDRIDLQYYLHILGQPGTGKSIPWQDPL
ncbi:hypothetical protein JNM05_10640 [bacterium]|nr:hypothetical protein [bacterium]